MIVPLHYVAGRDCHSLYEATCALYESEPGFTSFLLLLAIIFILLNIFLIYAIFIRKDDD